MDVTMVRHAYLDSCTLGFLYVGSLTFATLEERWRADPDGPGGQARRASLAESCVPDGAYVLLPHSGPKEHDVWALSNIALGVYPDRVPPDQSFGRACILIHAGNTVTDTEGCILIGRRHGFLNGMHAVLASRDALAALREALGVTQKHSLLIRATAGTEEITHR